MTIDSTTKNKELSGKTAIVTGGAKGIGKGIALELLNKGACVIIADKDKKESIKVVRELKLINLHIYSIPTDICEEKEIKNLFEKTIRKFGGVDILVNNAGINQYSWGIAENSNPKEEIVIFRTNLIGPYLLTKLVVRNMIKKKTKGNIVFISSMHANVTQIHPAYTSTKAAINMLVKDLALELASHQIRVNSIAPGSISIRGKKDPKNKEVPLGYSGMPQDIATLVMFLISDQARYITGETIVIDGGLSLNHVWYQRYLKEKSKKTRKSK
jgi:NAD(P)-dependent dehydrogenase (short-subunit alcohol dehydrogenase family)